MGHVGFLFTKPLPINLFLRCNRDLKSRQERQTGCTKMELTRFLNRIENDDRGATAIEYGLIAALICISMISALQLVANENTSKWSQVQTAAEEVMGN